MRRMILIYLCIIIPFGTILTQQKYEPGVILLKINNPDVVTLSITINYSWRRA